MLHIHILTIFPDTFQPLQTEGMVARAIKKDLVKVSIYNLRNWTHDNYQSVDDHPYGGGAGMVMKIEPIYEALEAIKKDLQGIIKIVLTSAKGVRFNQKKAQEYCVLDHLIIICGHYEGVDDRVSEALIDEEISIGDYVLSGGEPAAIVIADAVARLKPGVLGNEQSLEMESHNETGLLEYPQYTKPEVFTTNEGKKLNVPPVLLSGDHKKIQEWRLANMKKIAA